MAEVLLVNRSAGSLIGRRIGSIRIEAPLGRGGMGEVYQGYDERLERLVALKTIRGRHLADPVARARFLREARHLSQLDHPNICRIYGIAEGEGQDFLILELVEGRTLAEVPTSELDREDRLRIAIGVAEALRAAHERKIVHRDLKPENVMLTDDGGVKVLDFGVSRSMTSSKYRIADIEAAGIDPAAGRRSNEDPEGQTLDDGATRTLDTPPSSVRAEASFDTSGEAEALTTLGSVVGTLRYMSPEQARGEAVGRATDLFSFGIMLQELVTGRSAYGEVANRDEFQTRVRSGDTEPATGLSPRLAGLIRDLTRERPSDRPTAETVLATLTREQDAPRRRRRRRRNTAAAIAVLGVIVAAIAATRAISRPKPLLEAGQTARIAVLPFENATGDPANDWFALGLRELTAETLAGSPSARLIPATDVIQAVESVKASTGDPGSSESESEFTSIGSPDSDQLRQLGRSLGSDLVLATAVTAHPEGYRLRYTLYDTGGSVGVGSFEASEPTQGANLLAARIAQRLDPDAVVADLRETFTENPLINQVYALGVATFQTEGAQAAEPFFRVCLARDTEFGRAGFQLAEMLRRQGEWGASQVLSEQVLERARAEDDLRLEADVLNLLATMAGERGRLEVADEYFRRVIEIARETGDRSREAAGIRGLGLNWYFRQDYQQSVERLREALEIFREVGDRRTELRVMANLGTALGASGDYEADVALVRQSLAIAEELGDAHALADYTGNLSGGLRLLGMFDEAREAAKLALERQRAIGSREGEALALSALADLSFETENFEQALNYTQVAYDLFTEIGSERGISYAAILLAIARYETGRDRESIPALLDQGETWFGETNDTVQLRAILAFESGAFATAVELQESLVATGNDAWDGRSESWLEAFRSSAKAGRAIPPVD